MGMNGIKYRYGCCYHQKRKRIYFGRLRSREQEASKINMLYIMTCNACDFPYIRRKILNT